MKVLHAYCLNYNIGDYALGMGVKNLLRQEFDIDLIGETNIQGREFTEYYINEVVNKKYDLLVIGGGGIIHGSHWPNGWFWLIEKDLIKSIKIPFVVYGVGNNYFEGESIPEHAVSHLGETYKYASDFSVRNDGSFERVVKQLSFKPSIVPDPGFHVDLNTGYQSPDIQAPYVLIQLADDKSSMRFMPSSRKNFVDQMRIVTDWLRSKYHVVFIPHVFDDIGISREICEGIPNTTILNFGDYAFDRSHEMIAYYKYAHFVLAMRGHGQIIPIGFSVPVIALSNHPKHSGLMKALGLEEYVVNINDSFSSDKLRAAIELLEREHNALVTKYEILNDGFSKQSKLAMGRIKKAISI